MRLELGEIDVEVDADELWEAVEENVAVKIEEEGVGETRAREIADEAIDSVLQETTKVEELIRGELSDEWLDREEVREIAREEANDVLSDHDGDGLTEEQLVALMDSMPDRRSSRCTTGMAATRLIEKVLRDDDVIRMLRDRLGIDETQERVAALEPSETYQEPPATSPIEEQRIDGQVMLVGLDPAGSYIGPFASFEDAVFYRQVLGVPDSMRTQAMSGACYYAPAVLTFADVYGPSTGFPLQTFQSEEIPHRRPDGSLLRPCGARIVWLRATSDERGVLYGIDLPDDMPGSVYVGPFDGRASADRWASAHGVTLSMASVGMDWSQITTRDVASQDVWTWSYGVATCVNDRGLFLTEGRAEAVRFAERLGGDWFPVAVCTHAAAGETPEFVWPHDVARYDDLAVIAAVGPDPQVLDDDTSPEGFESLHGNYGPLNARIA